MRASQSTTGNEYRFREDYQLITTTDLKGMGCPWNILDTRLIGSA